MQLLKKFIKKFSNSYTIRGANNKIIVVETNGCEKELKPYETIKGLRIEIYGSNNVIKIHQPFIVKDSVIKIGFYPEIHNDGAYVELGSTTRFVKNTIMIAYGKNQRLSIGKNTTKHFCKLMLVENSDIQIGENCMFGGDITIRGADGHAIFDINTQEIQNTRTSQLQIHNHCWIGEGCLILKNAIIPENSIVGARSLVNKKFKDKGTLIAGIPAVVKKTGVNWTCESPSYFIENKIKPLEGNLAR